MDKWDSNGFFKISMKIEMFWSVDLNITNLILEIFMNLILVLESNELMQECKAPFTCADPD